jgi:hypothetical protein
MAGLTHHGSDEAESGLPIRTAWPSDFPPVAIHTIVRIRDRHVGYAAAKSGAADAAWLLARDLMSERAMGELRHLVGPRDRRPILLPVTALETTGFNAIPDAMAGVLSHHLGWSLSPGNIVQNNTVGHTRAKSFNRLVTPASFEGPVEVGGLYVLVDDHVGLGGTLANLRGHVETSGGVVIAMTTLTESRDGRHIALRSATLDMLWERHGKGLETLWRERLGHGLDCLTNLEGEILCRELSVDEIAGRLAEAAVEARGRGLGAAVRVGG